jgi:osmotically-inducible protein OsmY
MGELEMRLAKTAKRGAKGWVGVKAVKGAGKGATKAVRRRRRGPSAAERAGRIAAGLGVAGALAFVLAKIDRRKAAGRAKGAVQSVGGGKDYDDVTLARKVETELFRPDDVPKGEISVNVNDGVVELRGEISDQAQIDKLGDAARKVSGVKDVRNLLHTGANGG